VSRYRLALYSLLALVILAGIGASLLVHQATWNLDESTRVLVEEAMTETRALDDFRSDLLERERLAHQAYATLEPGPLAQAERRLARSIQQRWPRLREWGLEAKKASRLQNHWDAIRQATEELYANLEADRTDWDAARSQLTAMTHHRKAMAPSFEELGESLGDRTRAASARNRNDLAFLSRLVAVYTGIISLIALLMAGLIGRFLTISRHNQALAEFPQRNPDPVLNLDAKGRVDYANPATGELVRRLDGPGVSAPVLLDPESRADILDRHCGQREVHHAGRTLLFHWYWLPDLGRCHVYVRDITEQRRAEDRLRQMAYEDAVTGLPNRAWLLERLEAGCTEGEPGILALSLDRFGTLMAEKGFEATYTMLAELGHALQETATEHFGAGTAVARLDGGVFGLVVPAEATLTTTRAEALRRTLPRTIRTPHALFQTEYHIGLREPEPRSGSTRPTQLLQDAHTALLAAQGADEERVIAIDTALREAGDERLQIEHALHEALREERGLQLFIQPKVRLDDGVVTGGEFLIRWEDPQLGWISPGRFISVAERSGLIMELGKWVLEQALASLAEWRRIPASAHFQGAVNIAPPELQDPAWAEGVLDRLRATGLPPEALEIEVTERVLASSESSRTLSALRRLREAGVAVSVDDFGTGYSSLAYIHRLPITRVKIDKQFIDPLPVADGEVALAQVIVDMAEGLGLDTVAEGIEYPAQGDALRAAGCGHAQGFYYARPMPVASLPEWLNEKGQNEKGQISTRRPQSPPSAGSGITRTRR